MKTATHLYLPELIRAMPDEEGVLYGYGSVFNVVDWYGTKVARGAYKKTIREKMPLPMLWNHNPDIVIGQIVEAKEDSKGLYLKAQLNLDIEQARDVYSNYKKGIIRGFSIGGWIIKAEDDDDGITTIMELALDEISAVTFPANEEALVEMVRARTIHLELDKNKKEQLINKVVDEITRQLNKYKTEKEIEKEILFELKSLQIKRASTREEATNLLIELMAEEIETGGADLQLADEEADELNAPSDEPALSHSLEIELINLFKETNSVRKHSKTN